MKITLPNLTKRFDKKHFSAGKWIACLSNAYKIISNHTQIYQTGTGFKMLSKVSSVWSCFISLGKKTQSMTFSTEHRADLMTEVLVSNSLTSKIKRLIKVLTWKSAQIKHWFCKTLHKIKY